MRQTNTCRKVAGSISDEVIRFVSIDLILPAQPLTEMSTRDLLAGKGRPAHKADNLTAICEPIV
jgi:hypothetical protein